MTQLTSSTGMERVFAQLVSQVRRGQVVFFLGAGVSADEPASLPTSDVLFAEFVRMVLPRIPAPRRIRLTAELAKRVRFESFFQLFLNAFGTGAAQLLQILERGKPNYYHELIARLAADRLTPLVVTTNFDGLIERALIRRGLHHFELWHLAEHYRPLRRCIKSFRILKLHGSLQDKHGGPAHDSIAIAVNQVGRPIGSGKRTALEHILRTYHVVFLGYSGMDDFDILPILASIRSSKSIYWVEHQATTRLVCASSRILRAAPSQYAGRSYVSVLSSRDHAWLIRGPTWEFVARLYRQVFGSRIVRPRGERAHFDFTYLTDWRRRHGLAQHRQYLAGRLYLQAAEYSKAVACLDRVPEDSPLAVSGALFAALACKYGDRVDEARRRLASVARRSGGARDERLRARSELGLLEIELNRFSIGRRHLSAAIRLQPTDPVVAAELHNHLGVADLIEADLLSKRGTHTSSRKLTERLHDALCNFEQARPAVMANGVAQQLANIDDNIGLTYTLLGAFGLAKPRHFEALRIYKALYQHREAASCLDNIGIFYLKQGRWKQALRYLLEAHYLKEKYSTRRRLALTKHNIGELFYLRGEWDAALRWLTAARDIFEQEKLWEYARASAGLVRQICRLAT